MRVLITGISGMAGSHLADYILGQHSRIQVHGLVRSTSTRENVRHIEHRITVKQGDLLDLGSLVSVFETEYDWVFHLAAQSFVPYSFVASAITLQTNAVGTANLLDAIRTSGQDPSILLCSSSEVYGQVEKDELPIVETQPFRPQSPYAVSKVAADLLGQTYHRAHGLRIITTRAFTHTGPRRGGDFAASHFARQIAEIEAGWHEGPICVGNLDSVRTWTDVRDMVRAYWYALEKCQAGEVYNVGSDRTATVRDVLGMLKELSGCTVGHVEVGALMRPADVTLQIPNVQKFIFATGWQPEIPLEQTLQDLLEWHRGRIARIL